MDKVKSNTNFWTEISEYKIQVPCYQRDYAQGRIDDRIDNIRKVFVEELFQAISTEEKTCHLGLVFGSYDETNKIFIAVDGQQRLTTVFLLLWYVAWREGKINDYKEQLVKFSWNTRSYSSQFVNLLFRIGAQDNIVDAIKSHSDYFSIWENDPTVKGMLTMLEEIERQYPKVGGLCQKLFSDDCNIRYDILKLGKDSDGKTYLKMNSRGRSLTTFELFKSKFIDEYKPTFGNKFDNAWLNFMLTMAKSTTGQFGDPDISFMNFINEYVYLKLRLKEDKKASQEFINAKMKGDLTDVPFISFDHYKIAFDGDCDSFEKSFDWIISNYAAIKKIDDNLRFKESHFFIDAIIRDNNPNYSHRTKLFAAIRFAQLTEYESINELLYKRWTRVIRNVVANSSIDAENFGRICKSINDIDNSDLYTYLYNGGSLEAIDKDQIAEEIAKVEQILDEDGNLRKYKGSCKKEDGSDYQTWEEIIIDAEKYAFFNGAIRFLFTQKDIGDDWDDFDTKWNNAQKYFDENGVKNDIKVLLTKSLVIQCNNWNKQLYDKQIFNPNARTWKWILTVRTWIVPIHNILRASNINDIGATNEKNDENVKKFITPIIKDLPFNYFINNEPNGRFRWFGPRLCFYKPYGRDMATLDWENWHRNKILSSLLGSITTGTRMGDSNFFWGWNINFKYKDHFFQWYGNPNEKERDVYLMENDWADYKKRPNPLSDKGTDEDKYYCFRVTEEMESDTSLFTKALDLLID